MTLSEVIDLGGKVKFPRGKVVFAGDRHGATQYLHAHGQAGPGCLWIAITGGDNSTLIGGYGSTLTGGYRSTLTGGDCSTLIGENRSTLIIKRWDGERHRIDVAYVGENGIEAGVPYTFSDGQWVKQQ